MKPMIDPKKTLTKPDRILVIAIAILCALALTLVAVCAVTPAFARALGLSFEDFMTRHPVARVLTVCACVVLGAGVLAGAWMALFGVQEKKDDALVTLQTGEAGGVSVSETALRSLVRQALGDIEGSERSDVALSGDGSLMDATVTLCVKPGFRIADMAQQASARVRSALEDICGIEKVNVNLVVADIALSEKQDKPTLRA